MKFDRSFLLVQSFQILIVFYGQGFTNAFVCESQLFYKPKILSCCLFFTCRITTSVSFEGIAGDFLSEYGQNNKRLTADRIPLKAALKFTLCQLLCFSTAPKSRPAKCWLNIIILCVFASGMGVAFSTLTAERSDTKVFANYSPSLLAKFIHESGFVNFKQKPVNFASRHELIFHGFVSPV